MIISAELVYLEDARVECMPLQTAVMYQTTDSTVHGLHHVHFEFIVLQLSEFQMKELASGSITADCNEVQVANMTRSRGQKHPDPVPIGQA